MKNDSNETGTVGRTGCVILHTLTNACTFHHARIKPKRILDVAIKLQKFSGVRSRSTAPFYLFSFMNRTPFYLG